MRLIYRCAQCGAQQTADVPRTFDTLESVFQAIDMYAHGTPGMCASIRPWIRHQCAEELHGIANIVGVINE